MSMRPSENRLLSAIPGVDDDGAFAVVDVEARKPIYDHGEVIDQLYFPLDAVMSLVADMDDGSVFEIATVGREGVVGVEALIQSQDSDHRIFVQVPGRAVRVPTDRIRELVGQDPGLETLIFRYVRALMAQISRSAACNRAHPVDERTARWLLQTHDRVGRDDFPLTQEFLGQMLGVARPRVSTAAATLQRAGFIRYSRGHLRVTDRQGLEDASCECYRVITAEYERLLG